MSHPQIIHFPIALLSLAVLTEILSYFWQKELFGKGTLFLLVIGVITALIAVNTGEAAVDSLNNIASISSLLHQHENAGENVLKVFGLVLLVKLTVLYFKRNILSLRIVLTLLMFLGLFFIYQVGHFGGILVYERGVGIQQLFERND